MQHETELLAIHVAAGLMFLVVAGCSSREMTSNPTSPTPASQAVPTSVSQRKIAVGETIEVDLDATVSSGWYCEIGNDPVPCTSFIVDVPTAGTVVIRMEFDGDIPMFIQVGNLAVADAIAFVAGGSPLIAQAQVGAEPLSFRVGVNVPWGRRGAVVRYRVVASLE